MTIDLDHVIRVKGRHQRNPETPRLQIDVWKSLIDRCRAQQIGFAIKPAHFGVENPTTHKDIRDRTCPLNHLLCIVALRVGRTQDVEVGIRTALREIQQPLQAFRLGQTTDPQDSQSLSPLMGDPLCPLLLHETSARHGNHSRRSPELVFQQLLLFSRLYDDPVRPLNSILVQ